MDKWDKKIKDEYDKLSCMNEIIGDEINDKDKQWKINEINSCIFKGKYL